MPESNVVPGYWKLTGGWVDGGIGKVTEATLGQFHIESTIFRGQHGSVTTSEGIYPATCKWRFATEQISEKEYFLIKLKGRLR